MFTQCHRCETIFRLSAEALRAAGGQVRCGRCGDVFNALARLSEDVGGFKQGESAIEMETRAEEILETAQPVEPPLAMEPEVAAELAPDETQLRLLEPIDPLEFSLEFTLPPADLDRIFVETTPSVVRLLAAENSRGFTLPTSEPPAESPLPAQQPPPQPMRESQAARIPGLEISDDVRLEMLAGVTPSELPELPRAGRPLPWLIWAAAASLLALGLILQWVYSNTDEFDPSAAAGNFAAQLNAYQLRQWGITGDPNTKGTLRVRASILNSSATTQPYPLLRVTLADRFGTRIAERKFEPSEYMGKPTAHPLAPGERIDATMDIVDPGKDAEGFEIDVCIRGAAGRIACAGDTATTVK